MAESRYTILIICEGEKTEPLFFNSIRDELIDNKYDNDIRNLKITIAPEPFIDNEDPDNTIVKHKLKRKKRKTKSVGEINDIEIISDIPPLRWVLTAQRELATGAYNEVWAVFDNDDHPAKKEAFDKSELKINGDTINIAYSSRSFEYYLLIHFEHIYNKFDKTDCKFNQDGKDLFIRCGTNKYADKDCKGDVCINGYAQTKGYWSNSNEINTKKSETYHLIKDKLEVGFENSSWIRHRSNLCQSETPIYDRNPYLSIDKLVRNLIGNNNVYQWIELNKEYNFLKNNLTISVIEKSIKIKNTSKKTIIFPSNSITVLYQNDYIVFGERKIINKNETVIIDISDYLSEGIWFKLIYENHIIMFENKT